MEKILNQEYQTVQEFEAPELSLKDYIFILRRGMKLILSLAILVLAISVYYTFTVKPEYTAETSILIEPPEAIQSYLFSTPGSFYLTGISNSKELITSRRVAKEVVESLWNSPERNRLELFDTRVYKPRGQRLRRFFREVISLGTYDPAEDGPRQYEAGELTDTLERQFIHKIRKRLSVTSDRDTDIIKIHYTGPFPEETALIANEVADAYKKLDKEFDAEEMINLQKFLSAQVAVKEKELFAAENRLKQYQETQKIFSLEGNADNILSQLVESEAAYMQNQAELNIKQVERDYIAERLSEEEKVLVDKLNNTIDFRLQALREEIGRKESELIKNSSLYGEAHEVVVNLKKEIELLKTKLGEETQKLIARGLTISDPLEYRQELIKQVLQYDSEIEGLTARSKELASLVDQYNSQLNRLPQKQLEYARLERDRGVLDNIYNYMRQKLEETRISVAAESGKSRIIDRAIPTEFPTSPVHSRNILIGLILGLGLGTGVVFLREYLDNTVRSVDYMEKLGLTVLGVIPEVGLQYRPKGAAAGSGKASETGQGVFSRPSGDKLRRHLITREDPKSPVSESYRMIRTNILYSQADKPVKSVLVSSPGPGEGKTTTVTNLAITFANLGKRTLLIDTDLRRPVVHRIFDLDREPGMSNYLSGNTEDFNSLIHDTDIENLSVVSAGISPPNPSELLGSDRMSELVKRLEDEWDILLLDSPPISAVTDAAMVSKGIDAMILVVKAGSTVKESLHRSLQNLQGLKINLVGAVLNSVSKQNSYDSYYYYYQYYNHYYGRDN